MTIIRTFSEAVFACHSAACAPPSAGGTGGSRSTGKRGSGYITKTDPSGKLPIEKNYSATGRRLASSGKGSGFVPEKTLSKELAHQAKIADIRKKTGYQGDEMNATAVALKYRSMRKRTPRQTKAMKSAEAFAKAWSMAVRGG